MELRACQTQLPQILLKKLCVLTLQNIWLHDEPKHHKMEDMTFSWKKKRKKKNTTRLKKRFHPHVNYMSVSSSNHVSADGKTTPPLTFNTLPAKTRQIKTVKNCLEGGVKPWQKWAKLLLAPERRGRVWRWRTQAWLAPVVGGGLRCFEGVCGWGEHLMLGPKWSRRV